MFSSSCAKVIEVIGWGGAAAAVVTGSRDGMVVAAVVFPNAVMPDGAVVDAADEGCVLAVEVRLNPPALVVAGLPSWKLEAAVVAAVLAGVFPKPSALLVAVPKPSPVAAEVAAVDVVPKLSPAVVAAVEVDPKPRPAVV